MSFNIEFDFRFDTEGFFANQAARDALEAAAAIWEGAIGDDFETVGAGVSFYVSNPNTGASEQVTLDREIDDLLIFVGASDSPFGFGAAEPAQLPEGMGCGCSVCHEAHGTEAATVLARAGYSGFGASGDALNARITSDFRDQGATTDFEPFAGVMGFNTEVNWSYDIETVGSGFDFLTVAVHEIGHVLGIGTAPTFDAWVESGSFQGPNATSANGDTALPLHSDDSHVAAGHNGNSVVMDPSISSGQRVDLSEIDKALLADMGYEVAGYDRQGARFEITTEGDDNPVFGTLAADAINGLAGDDWLQGNGGADTLLGGEGGDTLFGQDGDDLLEGGAGNDFALGGDGADFIAGGTGIDTLYGEGGADTFLVRPGDGTDTIADFSFASDLVLIGAGFGFASAEEVLATASKPFSNVTRLELDPTTALDIVHSSQSGTPLTADRIRLEQVATPNSAPMAAPDEAAVTSGQSVVIDVLANDSDPDGDQLSIGAVGTPGGGSVEVVDDMLVYTASPGFTGLDQFDYAISDGNGGGAGSFVSVTVLAAGLQRIGTAGDDALVAGEGADTLMGERGADTLTAEGGDDMLDGGHDADRLFGGSGHDSLIGGSGPDTIFGNGGDDVAFGDTGSDTIGQSDVISGGAGNDALAGDGGADTLNGDDGNDTLSGGQGVDRLNGNAGDDVLTGGTERDSLNGGTGDDDLSGGDGNDILFAGLGNDTADGGAGPDFIDGAAGDDSLIGGAGDDRILGNGDNDTIEAGDGRDVARGGIGDDMIDGGDGDDRLFGEDGLDTVLGGEGDDLIFGNGGDDSLDGGAGDDRLIGDDGADTVTGGAGVDRVIGRDGDDLLFGGADGDRVDGGRGADSLDGGTGSDTLLGREGADELSGGDGVDVLRGGADGDLLRGGAGNDRMGGDAGADVFVFAPGDGSDLVFDFTQGLDLIRIEGAAADFASLSIGTDGAGRATVDYGGDPGDLVTLAGLSGGSLTAADFDFA